MTKNNDPKPIKPAKPLGPPLETLQSGELLDSFPSIHSSGTLNLKAIYDKYGSNIRLEWDFYKNSYGDSDVDLDIYSNEPVPNKNYESQMKIYEDQMYKYENHKKLLDEWTQREKARKEKADRADYERLKKRFENE